MKQVIGSNPTTSFPLEVESVNHHGFWQLISNTPETSVPLGQLTAVCSGNLVVGFALRFLFPTSLPRHHPSSVRHIIGPSSLAVYKKFLLYKVAIEILFLF